MNRVQRAEEVQISKQKLRSSKKIKIVVTEMAESELDVLVGDEAGPESQVRSSQPALFYRAFSSRSRTWGT